MRRRIVTWNIRSGGGARVPRILAEVSGLEPDVLVLTEYRDGTTGRQLRAGLAKIGLPHHHSVDARAPVNSLLIASRSEGAVVPLVDLPDALRPRIAAVRYEELTVVGVYFAQRQEKQPLYDWLLAGGSARFGARNVVIGDFNTGRNDLDREGEPFHAEDAFRALEACGWSDLWRRQHGARREYSWFSRAGNGFRIDHAFGSTALLPEVTEVRYEHAPRQNAVSDHSALVVTLRHAPPAPRTPS